MTKDKRLQFLKEVKEVLDKAEITFWVDWGTLLGFYREGDFIEFDPDIDIGIKREDQGKVMSVIMPKLGGKADGGMVNNIVKEALSET